jgi:ribosomal protein S18 acetylase RimI-like enzyme
MPLYPAVPAEHPEIAALVNGAYRGGGPERGWTTEADYIDGARTDAETLARDLAANPAARLLVWRDEPGGPILGCVWLEPMGRGEAWYLGMLTVRPDLQDRQLGRALLAAAEAVAAGEGARGVRMTVVNVRDTLIAWYERRGYVLTGEVLPFPYDDPVFGAPRRPDLAFVVLEKVLEA